MRAAGEQRLVKLEIRTRRRTVRPIGLDAGDVELPEPAVERIQQLVPEGEARVVRPDVCDVQAEARVREPLEAPRPGLPCRGRTPS